jgi:hypothetical protein
VSSSGKCKVTSWHPCGVSYYLVTCYTTKKLKLYLCLSTAPFRACRRRGDKAPRILSLIARWRREACYDDQSPSAQHQGQFELLHLSALCHFVFLTQSRSHCSVPELQSFISSSNTSKANTAMEFVSRYGRKLRKMPITVAGPTAEIQTQELLNVKQKCCPLHTDSSAVQISSRRVKQSALNL